MMINKNFKLVRTKQCAKCPWKVSTDPHDIPGGYCEIKHANLSNTIANEGEFNPGWSTFIQSGADMSFVITDSDPAAQGAKYYDMGGTVDWDWLLGLIDIPGSAYGATTFNLNSNPNNVYFNVMLSKIPGLNNGLVLFQFREDDNGDGVYTDGEEDLFSIQVALNNNDGWQLISSKYADMPTLINGVAADPIGNGIYEPEKLIQVSVLMLANPVSGYAQAYMDLMLFTENQPFKP